MKDACAISEGREGREGRERLYHQVYAGFSSSWRQTLIVMRSSQERAALVSRNAPHAPRACVCASCAASSASS